MPEMDGWEVLKIIKDHYPEEELKVLLLTAKGTDKDKMIGTSILKADGYITKPFDLQDLLQKVKMLLGE
jgi:DNA-binding response OmpR family regulator